MTSHTDGAGNVDTTGYDINDNVILAKDALGAGTNPFKYRNGSTLTQEVNSDYGTKTYSYNEADQLTQRLHGTRKCNYNTLDELGRYRAFVCAPSSGSTSNEYLINDGYTYDQSRYGRLDKVSTGLTGYDVDTLYSYDAYDRIIQKGTVNQLANRWLNKTGSLNVNYGYSLAGKNTSVTLPSGRVISYNYTTTGMLTGVNLDGSSLIRGISYDGANRMTGWLWGTGAASYTQSYNNDGSISSIINKNLTAATYSLGYSYDKDGRIIQISRNNGASKDNYSYDNVDRLTAENRVIGTTTTYSIAYGYDKNGNRTSLTATGQHTQPAASASYSYAGNKLSSFSKAGVGQTISHTGNGELNYGSYLPTYDNGGRRKVDRASADYYYMNYNHKNERSLRAQPTYGTATTVQYVYDEQSHLVGEYDNTGAKVEYVWLGDKPIAAIYGSGTATKIYYIVTDHLNTPRRLVDSVNHAIVWSWDSTAFGLGNPTASITFNLRFPGQYYDVGTGHFYNHNRYYNPELGRYMEADPIGLEGGLNPYAYAGSNPVMNTDSSGLAFETLLDASLAAISIKAAYDDTSWQNIAAATYDTAAVFVPFLPAGAGLAVKTTKNADKIKDAAQSYKQERKYWTQEPIIFKNLKVYKRDSLFDPQLLDAKGRTNLERMQKGIAPIGKDGESINLHHMLQTDKGGLVEVTKTFHQQNTKAIHINSGSGIPSGINRQEFEGWKKQYWKERARDFR